MRDRPIQLEYIEIEEVEPDQMPPMGWLCPRCRAPLLQTLARKRVGDTQHGVLCCPLCFRLYIQRPVSGIIAPPDPGGRIS